jgi:DNA-directed RNA polymerase specialized sigma24 family protein
MRPAELLARIQQLKLFELERVTDRPEAAPEPEPETVCFRSQTIAIVRHFFEISSQVGRLPSILGREFFRAKVSHRAIPSFEDQAVFVHDIERCLQKLTPEHAQMIAMVGLYDFSKEEVGAMLQRCRSWVNRSYLQALDALTQIFLDTGVLSEDRPDRRQWQVHQPRLGPEANPSSPKIPCSSVASYPAESGPARTGGLAVER